MFISDSEKFIYFHIPKTAGSATFKPKTITEGFMFVVDVDSNNDILI